MSETPADKLRMLPPMLQAKIHRDPDTGCWLCINGLLKTGYGQFRLGGKNHRAHRLVWELIVGPLTPGLELDHVCRVRRCCNPSHLREVTRRENVHAPGSQTISAKYAARDRCKNGHEFTVANTSRDGKGYRRCRACNRERERAARRAGRRRDLPEDEAQDFAEAIDAVLEELEG